MTLQGTWSIIVAHSVLLIPYWKPSLLKPPCLNCCYIGVQLYIAFWISPWNATFDDMFVLELLGFALGSVPAAVMATNALVLLLGWFPVCGVVLLRVSTETDFAVAQPDTVVNPRTLIFINILFTGWLLKIGFTRFWFPPKTLGGSMNVLPCFFLVLKAWFTGVLFVAYKLSTKLLQNSVESAIRENDSNSHRSAASSLLVLTCDAVSQRYQLRAFESLQCLEKSQTYKYEIPKSWFANNFSRMLGCPSWSFLCFSRHIGGRGWPNNWYRHRKGGVLGYPWGCIVDSSSWFSSSSHLHQLHQPHILILLVILILISILISAVLYPPPAHHLHRHSQPTK